MNQPPPWPNAPPGYAPLVTPPSPKDAWKKRVKTCGMVVSLLAGAHLLMLLGRVVISFLTLPLMRLYFNWLESMAPGVKLSRMIEPMEKFLGDIAIWQAVAAVPFVVCAIWLGLLGLRILKYDRRAFAGARVWTIAAGVAIAISTAIQLAVIVPASQQYSRAILSSMPHAGSRGAPFDMQQFMSSMTSAATVVGTLFSVVMLGAFPVALYLWTKKLEQDAPPA